MSAMTSQPVTFGLSLPNRGVLFGYPVEELLDAAVLAEESGVFGSVWVGDNYLSKPRLEALVTLAAIAGRTSRVRLGTICLASFTLRNPLELAIQWASLDVLSGGRTDLYVCLGAAAANGPQFAAELEAFGRLSRERVGRMTEGIELLRRFWSEEAVTHAGGFFRYEAVNALPKPVQQAMPVGIAVNPGHPAHGRPLDPAVEERALRRVARIGNGWQTDATPVERFRDRWDRIQEYAAEYGRSGEVRQSCLHLMVNINDDSGRAYRESVAFLDHYYGVGAIPEEAVDLWLAAGPPETVAEKIAAYVDAGCTTPVLRFCTPDQRGQIERCATEVIPLLAVSTG
jgi:alkanesulfonate monooxygenase SsuD/methylene tetrahydromethanopterin reductase-like flavin-dependent oxidoreductase (luciferase family)